MGSGPLEVFIKVSPHPAERLAHEANRDCPWSAPAHVGVGSAGEELWAVGVCPVCFRQSELVSIIGSEGTQTMS